MKDPIVEEVRKHRMEHTRRYGGDLSAIVADLREVQNTSGRKVVRLPAKRIDPTRRSGRPRKLVG
ncbi:MAG: hypothetical protein A4E57_02102 [Syntrophorhabdaceae bacterium PtaU1.Bin034]|nr:MAG: hypothetical protein A4E57_02102 [Syntrophorhabdaceae bacterium PtaU1.Bin034]